MSETVSIGVPAYNAEPFLDATLESILSQTHPDLEVIVSDNASTDRTGEIAQAWSRRDSRIRYVRNERNVGLVRNYNRLVHLASGRFFKWAGADDVIEPDFVRRSLAVFAREPDVVLVATRVSLVGADGQPLRLDPVSGRYVTSYGESKRPPESVRDELASHDPARRFRAIVLRVRDATLAGHTFALVRRDVLLRTHLLEVNLATDKILLAELAMQGRIEEIPEPLLRWRIHRDHSGRQSPEAMMRRLDPDWKGRFALAEPRQLTAYLRTISRADLSSDERLRCLETIVEKMPRGVAAQVLERIERRRSVAGD